MLFVLLVAAWFPHLQGQPSPPQLAEARRLNNAGVGLMTQQRIPEALTRFEQAAARDRGLTIARINQALALLHTQQTAQVRKLAADIVATDPRQTGAWFVLGLAAAREGDSAVALDAFTRAAALDPDDPDLHYFVGLEASRAGRDEQAAAAFERALALNPFHASAHFGIARVLQRSNPDRARTHLERFQRITESRLGAPIGQAYGDQGRYSIAQTAPADAAVPAPIDIRFTDISVNAGVARPATPVSWPAGAVEVGPGVCAFDHDGDGRTDLLLPGGRLGLGVALLRHDGTRYVDRTAAAGLSRLPAATSCVAGDFDNDGQVDIAIALADRVALLRQQRGPSTPGGAPRGPGRFVDVTTRAGISVSGEPRALMFVDLDHDGDLDLYITRAANGNLLWRNNGNQTFTDITAAAMLAGAGGSMAVLASDLNNDRAIDLVLTGRLGTETRLNPREGAFTGVPFSAGASAGVVALDADKDGWMDLALTHWQGPGLSAWRNMRGRSFERMALPAIDWTSGWGLAAADYDNDGWVDLIVAGEGPGGGALRVLRNEGPRGFVDRTAAVGLDRLAIDRPRALIALDHDADGDADLLVTRHGAPPILLRNDGGSRHASLALTLRGLNDNASGIGTKVEIFAGALWQKREVHGAAGFLSQPPLQVHAGLGPEKVAEIVRLLWPTGVVQDELDVRAGGRIAIREIDRRGSSCPVLFTWNGTRFEFIADAIGPGIVGHWVGPGQRNTPDPTEYLKIDGSRVQPRNGRLSFRFVEPMEEVVYLDEVRLLAIDHPSDAQVHPNERFAAAPPFPEHRIVASRGARLPAAARDDRGRDVLDALRARDRRYVTGFAHVPFKGFAALHALDLDLGDIPAGAPVRLLMHGLTDYFTASSIFAAHQAGVQAVLPYADALVEGRWVRISDNIGFPAGLARTMVADLTGLLPRGARRVRISTNLKIYWDQILVDTTPAGVPVRETVIPMVEATLGYRGYPRDVPGTPPADLQYVYDEVSLTGPYARQAGAYTRYGDVRRLVSGADDRFAVLGSGDEVALEFDAHALPPLAAGWTRDYFFYADGFAKDMDFYAAHGETLEPFPYHAMPAYPYPPGSRGDRDARHVEYLLDENTRLVSGREAGLFRFLFR